MERLIIKPLKSLELQYDASIEITGASYAWLEGDNNFIYASGAGDAGDIDVYSYNNNIFTHESSNNILETNNGTYKMANYLLGTSSSGVKSYTVDSSGKLSEVDFHANTGTCYDVVYDGNYVYVSTRIGADGSIGVLVFSIDSSGFFTYESSIGNIFVGIPSSIDADGSGGVFQSSGAIGGFNMVHSLKDNGSGILTLIDSAEGSLGFTQNYTKLKYDNNKIFSTAGFFEIYDVDPSGFLTKIFQYNNIDNQTIGRIIGIDIDDKYAYISSWQLPETSLQVFNKNSPFNLISTIDLPSSISNYDVYKRSLSEIFTSTTAWPGGVYSYNLSYQSIQSNYNKLNIIPAISTSSSLTEIHSLQTGAGSIWQMNYDGNFFYIVDGILGIQTYHYDSTNGFTLDSSTEIGSQLRSGYKGNNYYYASFQSPAGVKSYSVDVSGNLSLISVDTAVFNVRGIVVNPQETFLYSSNQISENGYLRCHDISTNGVLTYKSQLTLDPSVGSATGSLLIDGSILHMVTISDVGGYNQRNISSYVIDSNNGSLTKADIWFSDVSVYLIGVSNRISQIKSFNNKLYVAMDEFRIFEVDSSGFYTSVFSYRDTSSDLLVGVDVDSTNIYVTDASNDKIHIFNTSNPTTPTFSSGAGSVAGSLNIFATGVNEIVGLGNNAYLAKYEFVDSDPGEISKLIIENSISPSITSIIDIAGGSPNLNGLAFYNLTTALGQTFKATQNSSSIDIEYYANKVNGSPDSIMKAHITGLDVNNKPDIDNILGTSQGIDTSTYSVGISYIGKFNITGLNLINGNSYGIIISLDSIILNDGSNFTMGHFSDGTDPSYYYSDGIGRYSTNDGSTWIDLGANDDFIIKITQTS